MVDNICFIQYAVTDKPEHREFDIGLAMTTDFPETGFQPLYFTVESLEDIKTLMRYKKLMVGWIMSQAHSLVAMYAL